MVFAAKEDVDRMLAQHHKRREKPGAALTRYEFRFVTRSGDVRDVILHINLIPGTDWSVASMMDITDRKKAEEELQSSEEWYLRLLERTFL